MEYLGSVEFVDQYGDLIRHEDYFNVATGMPYTKVTVLRRGVKRLVSNPGYIGEPEFRTDPMTGATIRVRKYRNRFGEIEEQQEVWSLNNGDDGEGEARWGRGDGEW